MKSSRSSVQSVCKERVGTRPPWRREYDIPKVASSTDWLCGVTRGCPLSLMGKGCRGGSILLLIKACWSSTFLSPPHVSGYSKTSLMQHDTQMILTQTWNPSLHGSGKVSREIGIRTGHASVFLTWKTYDYVCVWRECMWIACGRHPCRGQSQLWGVILPAQSFLSQRKKNGFIFIILEWRISFSIFFLISRL